MIYNILNTAAYRQKICGGRDLILRKEINMTETRTEPELYNMLATSELVVFPDMMLHFEISGDRAINAINYAVDGERMIFITMKKDPASDISLQNLNNMGCLAQVRQVIKLPNKNLRVMIAGCVRARLCDVVTDDETDRALVIECCDKKPRVSHMLETALIRHAQDLFGDYSELSKKISPDITAMIMSSPDAGSLADRIASNLPLDAGVKQDILCELNPVKRLESLIFHMTQEIEILGIEHDISEKVKSQIDRNQREYYLREQIKVINMELSEGDGLAAEADEYIEEIKLLDMDEQSKDKLIDEASKLYGLQPSFPETAVIRNYLDTCLLLPWNERTKDSINIKKAQKILDAGHYGLDDVKKRIIELLAVRRLAPDIKGQIICLVGPPGVGKTSIAKSIAECMGRRFARISLGGIRDEADIRGHRKTYIGAMPGRIMEAMKLAGSKNPLILMDEVDKIGADYRGDPAAALLEVLDSEQNTAFRDHYIELPFDLSDTLFVLTANTLQTVPETLIDRMEIIELPSYTREEKFHIAKKHLLKKQMKRHGLTPAMFRITDSAIRELIDGYTREAGVRSLERELASLCRKAAKLIVGDGEQRVSVNTNNLTEMLGKHRYRLETVSDKDEVGVVNGLAWTWAGGELMQIEAAALEGSGKIVLTGSLGDVMKESAQAAVSYIRSISGKFGIESDFYKTKDIHIHATEGAVPKDGPSAGVTMVTAVVSALTRLPVRRGVAMTGEITIRGRVLPIGGLREKTMAAYKCGIKTVIIPEENVKDLDKIDTAVRSAIRFVPVSDVSEVLKTALCTSSAHDDVMHIETLPKAKITARPASR